MDLCNSPAFCSSCSTRAVKNDHFDCYSSVEFSLVAMAHPADAETNRIVSQNSEQVADNSSDESDGNENARCTLSVFQCFFQRSVRRYHVVSRSLMMFRCIFLYVVFLLAIFFLSFRFSPSRCFRAILSSTGLKFRQQELWAVKPVWSPRCVVIMYYIVAAIFIPIGIAVLVSSLRMMQTDSVRYDNLSSCDVGSRSSTNDFKVCTFKVRVTKDTKAPSYLYYGLRDFYQNARNYIKSRSFKQLRGDDNPDLGECDDAGAQAKNAVPCGLTAVSRFNDTFDLCRDEKCEKPVKLQKEGIAWDIDVKKRFRPGPVGKFGYTSASNDLVTDEDFMVWMRLSPYHDFHKLYRIIKEDLKEGSYYVRVNASYPVNSFGGEKFIFISETSWLGGRSRILAAAYLAVGGIGLVMATVFAVCAGTSREKPLPPETSVPPEGYAHDPYNNTLAEPAGASPGQTPPYDVHEHHGESPGAGPTARRGVRSDGDRGRLYRKS